MAATTERPAETEQALWSIDPRKLNSRARRRLERGLFCFTYPEGDHITAVCRDFGLHARGATKELAQEELTRVIEDFVCVAYGSGELETFLSRPDSHAAADKWRRVRFVYAVVRGLLALIAFSHTARSLVTGREIAAYRGPFPPAAHAC